MIKSINKDANINMANTTHDDLEKRLMVELENRQEFACYGKDCNGGYCSGTYNP